MPQAIRSAVTLVVLAAVLALGAVWGWSSLTAPFPGRIPTPTCVDTTVEQDERVRARQVTVSVLNAGTREGLAGRTMRLFTDQGFNEGDSDNAPEDAEVAVAVVWTREPTSPAVRLVLSRLPEGTEIVRRDAPWVGVVVVVGDGFEELRPGRKFSVAAEDTEICSPPV